MKKFIIIWDLDGTLTNCDDFEHHVRTIPKNWDKWNENIRNHKPNVELIELFKMYAEAGHDNYISTARMENVRYETELWLADQGLHTAYKGLFMRGMTDYRPDYEVKLDVLNTLRNNNIFPDIAYEDRGSVVQMYRENGLRCFQVDNGDY
jgi:hypothetical protein